MGVFQTLKDAALRAEYERLKLLDKAEQQSDDLAYKLAKFSRQGKDVRPQDIALEKEMLRMSEDMAGATQGITRTVREMVKKFGPIEGEIIGKELERKAANIHAPAVNKPVSPVDKMVKEPPFNTWFWQHKPSKVVDQYGRRQKMYHATPEFKGNDFEVKPPLNNLGGNVEGFYFSPDPTDASQYLESVWGKATGNPEKGQIIPVYLNAKNPWVDWRDKLNKAMADQYRKELRRINPKVTDDWIEKHVKDGIDYGSLSSWALRNDAAAKQRIIKRGGYDSYQDGGHIAVFDPRQIRSIYRTNQNFNRGGLSGEGPITALGGKEYTPNNTDLLRRLGVQYPDNIKKFRDNELLNDILSWNSKYAEQAPKKGK